MNKLINQVTSTSFFLSILFFTGALCMAQNSLAQSNRIFFNQLTTEEGLSQNDVNCIMQDRKGFMWFGTNDGLNRYDGYEFTIFKPDPTDPYSINSNLIFGLAEDSAGRIWIGTVGSGLNCFDPKTHKFYHFRNQSSDLESLSNDHIRGIWIDHKERLWIATIDGLDLFDMGITAEGEIRLSAKHTRTLIPPILQTGSVYKTYQENDSIFWIGTGRGLFRIIADENSQGPFKAERIDIIPNIASDNVYEIMRDKHGSLVVAMSSGLYYQTGTDVNDHPIFTQLANSPHSGVIQDNFQQIWATSSSGLERLVKQERQPFPTLVKTYHNNLEDPHSLNKDVLRTICMDKNGMVWVGTNGGGVNMFDPGKMTVNHIKKNLNPGSLGYDKIRSMREDSEGNLWVGTEGGGLDFLSASLQDGKYNRFQHTDAMMNVFALEEVKEGDEKVLYFGGQHNIGLFKLEIPDGTIPSPKLNPIPIPGVHRSVFSILNEQDKYLWVGTYIEGLLKLRLRPGQSPVVIKTYLHNPQDPTSISNNIIRSLLQDHKGNIWIGTGGGLNFIPSAEKEKDRPNIHRFLYKPDDFRSLSHNYILPLFESRDGTIWIGTFGGGMNKFVPERGNIPAHFIRYTEEDGLANNVVKGILEDQQGFLWISTNKGLSRFDPQTEEFKNYDTHDGLQSNEFSELACFQRKNGEMLFGGVNGFNAFMPQNFRDNSYLPEVVFTELQVLNKTIQAEDQLNTHVILPQDISETETIELNYNENSFSIEFAAIHYSAPSKNQYKYKLEGFNKDWIYVNAQKRSATYTNLSPGEYTILVKASNNDGIWNEKPASIRIRISPPFWRTWWAYISYFVIIIALLAAFRRYTIIGIREKHELVLEHLEKEQAEELHQMKLQFFTNISHELRTPLSLISGPLEYLIKSGQGMNYGQREHQYRLIQKNANYLLRLVNQLLDFRKLDQGKMKLRVQKRDVVTFIHETTEPFRFIANKKNIDYEIISQYPEVELWFDPDVLEKTIYNLLSNAFKFTPEHGQIRIEIEPKYAYKKKTGKSTELLEIRVRDSGSGIEPDMLKKIFHRFFKSPQTDSFNKPGTGIGLAYTQSLIQLHRGSISVDSEIGSGTCFIITLPLGKSTYKKQEIVHSFSSSTSKQADSVSPSDVNGQPTDVIDQEEEILEKNHTGQLPLLVVIDDYEDIRSFIRQAMIGEYRIIEASDGAKGLALIQEHLPDMVISDVMMPKMDGIELCKTVKTDTKTSHIPLILLTAKSSEESELKGLSVGADAYVHKPFKVDILKAKMQNILTQRHELKSRYRREIMLEPESITVTSADETFLKRAMEIVEEHMGDPDFNVENMVKEIGMSRSKLYLKLKALTDQSTSEFIRSVRLKRAVQLLETSDMTVKEIMYMTGFNTASYFSKCFKKQFGVSPSEYLKKEVRPVI